MALGAIGTTIVLAALSQMTNSPATIAADAQRVCASITKKQEASIMQIVYKIESSYMVYVEPS